MATKRDQTEQEQFEAADRMFDGGEFSGPAQDRMRVQTMEIPQQHGGTVRVRYDSYEARCARASRGTYWTRGY